MHPGGRTRPSSRKFDDSLAEAGASALANIIRIFWLQKGKVPKVWLEKQSVASAEGGSGLYCVRSNMRGGWPV